MRPIIWECKLNDISQHRYNNNHPKYFILFKYAMIAYSDSLDRVNKIEQKALGLVQFTAISTSILFILIQYIEKPSTTLATLLLISFISSIISISLDLYAMKIQTLWVANYHIYDIETSRDDLIELGNYSHNNNNIADLKADIIKCAQVYFIISYTLASFISLVSLMHK